MKLNKQKLYTQKFSYQLPAEFDYLSPLDETTFIWFKCNAGGYANPDYLARKDEIELATKVDLADLPDADSEKGDRFKALEKVTIRRGLAELANLYDTCITEWGTNIQNDGSAMELTRDNFLSLAEVKIEAIADAFIGLSTFILDVTKFSQEADEEILKN